MCRERVKEFTNRIVDDWNSLPKEVKEAPTQNTFKNRFDKSGAASRGVVSWTCDIGSIPTLGVCTGIQF